MLSIYLYQPNNVLQPRLEVADLAAYIKALNATALGFLDKVPAGSPAIIDLVVAFKPSGKSKVWILADDNFAKKSDLTQKLESVPVAKSKEGPVAFCIHASVWGGAEKAAPTLPPIPKEWSDAQKASQKPLIIPDDVLPLVWKD
jgi:hypothetical protein